MYVCHTNQIGSTINSQSNFLLEKYVVCEKISSRYSSPIKEKEMIFISMIGFTSTFSVG